MIPKNFVVAGACVIGVGCMALLPAVFRSNMHVTNKDKLSGSQRQRGMYMNAGSHDAGVDPDWDPVTKQWNGFKKSNEDHNE